MQKITPFIKNIVVRYRRFIQFGIVGISGIAVNMGFFWLFKEFIGVQYKVALIAAIEFSIISNYILNAIWTWKDRSAGSAAGTLWQFLKANITGGLIVIMVNWVTAVLLHEKAGLNEYIAHASGIVLSTVVNYIVYHYIVFTPQKRHMINIRSLDDLIHIDLKTHFYYALLFGFIVRMVIALCYWGFMSNDDLMRGIYESYRIAIGQLDSIPAFRVILLPWLGTIPITISHMLFGTQNPVIDMQIANIYFGIISLSVIIGMYYVIQAYQNKLSNTPNMELFSRMALYASALYFLLPFIGKLMFAESVTAGPIFLGFGLAEYGFSRDIAGRKGKSHIPLFGLGVFIIAVSVLIRLQAVIVLLVYLVTIIIRILSDEYHRRRILDYTIWVAVVGIVAIGMQMLMEYMTGRAFMEAWTAYLKANENAAVNYGSMEWHVYILFIFLLTLPPTLFFFWKQFWEGCKKFWVVSIIIAVFILIHSCIGHKEERFMFTIIPFVTILIAYMLFNTVSQDALKPLQRFFRKYFIIINMLLLTVLITTNSQPAVIKPFLAINHDPIAGEKIMAINMGMRDVSRGFYLRKKLSRYVNYQRQFWIENPQMVNNALNDFVHSDAEKCYIIGIHDDFYTTAASYINNRDDIMLSEIKHFSVPYTDSIVYALNPKYNQWRRPSWAYVITKVSQE